MITLIDNEPVSFQPGTMSEEEYVKTDEFKEIAQALGTLAKHCPSLVVSGYSKDDHIAFVYNHAGQQTVDHPMAKLVEKTRGEKAAREAIRGTELATHISNLVLEAEEQYNVNGNAVIETVTAGRTVLDKLKNLSKAEKKELLEKVKSAESMEDAREIMRAFSPEALENLTNKRRFGNSRPTTHKIREKLEKDFGDSLFAQTAEKTDINPKEMERTIRLATGKDAKVCKMSDPEVIKPLAESLAANLKATAFVGFIRFDNDDIKEPSDVGMSLIFQEGLDDIAKRCDADEETVEVAAAGCFAMAVLENVKKKYHLPDGLFERYMKNQNL